MSRHFLSSHPIRANFTYEWHLTARFGLDPHTRLKKKSVKTCFFMFNSPSSRSIQVISISAMWTTPRYIRVKFEWIPCRSGEADFPTKIHAVDPAAQPSQTHTGPTFKVA